MIDKNKLLKWIKNNTLMVLGLSFVSAYALKEAIDKGEFDTQK